MKVIGSLLSYEKSGLFSSIGGFHIDPSRKVSVALVSHAHGDHALPNHEVIYCTNETWAIMEHRYGSALKARHEPVSFGEPFNLGDVIVTFHAAGHILGSAQILMEFNGERYLYTGDFKTQHDPTCEKYETVRCDYLITETTFAHPDYSHPEPELALAELLDENVPLVIGAYSVGKAQRITRLLHDLAPYRNVHVHPMLMGYHSVYEKAGIELGNWRPYARKDFMRDSDGVLLLPPGIFIRYDRHPGALKVFATGWKKSYYRCDRVLPISDHVDWIGLIKVIADSGARTIFTLHGDGSLLRDHLNGSGKEVVLLENRL
ncbi:MAG: MBL fold metallo-hydrolase [Bacteroidota bacterium]